MTRSGEQFWEDNSELIKRKLVPLSSTILRDLGVKMEFLNEVENLVELRKSPPNIVIGEAKTFFRMRQNTHNEDQTLQKGYSYIMGLGIYQQIHTDPKTKLKILKPSKIKFKGMYRPYIGQDLTDKSILVFRTGGIGDLLFIQPNLRYLKEKYPTCTIKFACGPQYQSMVESWDCVDELIDLPFNVSELRNSNYHSLFEGVIERCRQARNNNAYRLFSSWMGLNLPDELLIPKQKPKEKCVEEFKTILSNLNIEPKDFLLFQLRSSTPIRTPSLEFWKKMIDDLTDRGIKIAIIDSKRMSEKVEIFIKTLKNTDKVYNFAEYSPTLDYTIAATSLASMVVATDSALIHIAASLDVKCYGIFGPFPGEIRLSTYKKAKWVNAQRHCAPCFLHQPTPCNQATVSPYSPCYNNIDIKNSCDEIEGFIND